MGDNPTNPLSIKFPDPMEWAAKLKGRPLFEISGVVSPSGASAGNSLGQQVWTFLVRLDVWKHAGGRIQTTPLILRKPMTREEFNALAANFNPYDVVRVHARLAEGAANGRFEALLDRFIGKPTDDPELNEAARERQKSVTIESARFGQFTLNRRVGWFEAKTEWCGVRIRLTLPVENNEGPEESIRLAEKLWDAQSDWDQRVTHFATAELLPLKNGTWLNEDESPLTAEEFKKKMKLESVTVNTDGTLEFWFNDGAMFGEHAIRVGANFTDGPIDAGIEG